MKKETMLMQRDKSVEGMCCPLAKQMVVCYTEKRISGPKSLWEAFL